MVSLVLDRFGRKNTFYLINAFSFASWITIATASNTDRESMFSQLLAGRILLGISSGLSSSPCAIYTAEIAHSSLRGRMSILSSLGISVGILFVYITGFFIPVYYHTYYCLKLNKIFFSPTLRFQTNWRLISGICVGWSVLAFALVVLLPETPSWLVSKGRVAEAERSLKLFRGLPPKGNHITTECKAELALLIEKHRISSSRGTVSLLQKFTTPEFYKPLGIMVGFFAFQQFSGIFVLIVYAVKFSLEAGVVIDPFLCAVYIGIVRIVATLLMGVVMDRFGRRLPAMFSGVVMAVCMFGIGGYIASGSSAASWLPVLLILSYIFASSLGLLTLPFTMMAELFPQRFRGLASGITIGALYSMSFVVTKLYPTMVNKMGTVNVFVFYGVVSISSVVFVYFILPETKGKTLEQIEDIFKKRERFEDVNENLMLTGNEKMVATKDLA